MISKKKNFADVAIMEVVSSFYHWDCPYKGLAMLRPIVASNDVFG